MDGNHFASLSQHGIFGKILAKDDTIDGTIILYGLVQAFEDVVGSISDGQDVRFCLSVDTQA